jgi:hypothetical protein
VRTDNSCRHQADADLRASSDNGLGDVPLTELRFRCSQCGTVRRRAPLGCPIHPSGALSRMPIQRDRALPTMTVMNAEQVA